MPSCSVNSIFLRFGLDIRLGHCLAFFVFLHAFLSSNLYKMCTYVFIPKKSMYNFALKSLVRTSVWIIGVFNLLT